MSHTSGRAVRAERRVPADTEPWLPYLATFAPRDPVQFDDDRPWLKKISRCPSPFTSPEVTALNAVLEPETIIAVRAGA